MALPDYTKKLKKANGQDFKGNVLFEDMNKGKKFTSIYSSSPSSEILELDISKISGESTTPKGAVVMFAGKSIPNGWALCDGQNGTIDLTDKFIIAADPDVQGDHGKVVGSHDAIVPAHTHEIEFLEVPGHTHKSPKVNSIKTTSAGKHTHKSLFEQRTKIYSTSCSFFMEGDTMPPEFWGWDNFCGGKTSIPAPMAENSSASGEHGHVLNIPTKATSPAGGHSHTVTISEEGQDLKGLNKPPYYVLAFIEKL